MGYYCKLALVTCRLKTHIRIKATTPTGLQPPARLEEDGRPRPGRLSGFSDAMTIGQVRKKMKETREWKGSPTLGLFLAG